MGIECGGWCPKGHKAEDGVISSRYPLTETPLASYSQRTEWNVRDSDGTVIFCTEVKVTGGSKKTIEFATKHKKPFLHLHSGQGAVVHALRHFVTDNNIATLNVAGPRASKEERVGEFVVKVLQAAFPR